MLDEVNSAIKELAKKLKLSNIAYINSLKIRELYERNCLVTQKMIYEIIDDFPVKSNSKIDSAFRSQIKSLPLETSCDICNFIIGLNFIENARITSQTMANIWLDERCLFYMAFGQFRGKNIESSLENYRIVKNIGVIGNRDAEESSFIYVSNFQRFTTPHNHPKWKIMLNMLNLSPDTTIIKIGSKELAEILLPIIQKI